MDSQSAAGQSEAKAQQNPQPQVPPTAPGGARREHCGFWSALSPHLSQPRTANPCPVFGVGFAVGVDLFSNLAILIVVLRALCELYPALVV